MGNSYDAAVDKHLDHTPEKPNRRCYFCNLYGWVEEEEVEKKTWKENFMTSQLEKLNKAEAVIEAEERGELLFGDVEKAVFDYNRALTLLHTEDLLADTEPIEHEGKTIGYKESRGEN